MFNGTKIHDYLLPLLLCSLATTGCVTQEAPVVIVQPAAAPSTQPSPAGFTPYIPPTTTAANPAQSAPAPAPVTPEPATKVTQAAPVAPPVADPKAPTDSAAQTPFSSAPLLIPVTGKVVYRLPAAPGEPSQYILVDSDRPPVTEE